MLLAKLAAGLVALCLACQSVMMCHLTSCCGSSVHNFPRSSLTAGLVLKFLKFLSDH